MAMIAGDKMEWNPEGFSFEFIDTMSRFEQCELKRGGGNKRRSRDSSLEFSLLKSIFSKPRLIPPFSYSTPHLKVRTCATTSDGKQEGGLRCTLFCSISKTGKHTQPWV